jgi:hypothetical protein
MDKSWHINFEPKRYGGLGTKSSDSQNTGIKQVGLSVLIIIQMLELKKVHKGTV